MELQCFPHGHPWGLRLSKYLPTVVLHLIMQEGCSAMGPVWGFVCFPCFMLKCGWLVFVKVGRSDVRYGAVSVKLVGIVEYILDKQLSRTDGCLCCWVHHTSLLHPVYCLKCHSKCFPQKHPYESSSIVCQRDYWHPRFPFYNLRRSFAKHPQTNGCIGRSS